MISSIRRDFLTDRNFLALLIGRVGSGFGSSAFRLAVVWWALSATGSALDSGVVVAVQLAASTLFAPLGGLFVDRMDRKRLLVAADLSGGLVVGAAGWLAAAGSLALPTIVAVVAWMGVINAAVTPATKSLLSSALDEETYNDANSVYGTLLSVAEIAGPAAIGALLAVFPFSVVFAVNAGSYLLAAIAELFLTGLSDETMEEPGGVVSELREGFAFVRTQPTVRRVVIAGASINLFTGPVVLVLSSIFEFTGESAAYAGTAQAIVIGGVTVAGVALFALPFEESVETWRTVFVGGIVTVGGAFVLGGAALAFVPSSLFAASVFAFAGIFGLGAGAANITSQSVLQATADEDNVGRVFGFFESLVSMTLPIAYVIIGALMDAFPPSVGVTVLGTGALLTAAAVGPGLIRQSSGSPATG